MNYDDKPPYIIYVENKQGEFEKHTYQTVNDVVRKMGFCNRYRYKYKFDEKAEWDYFAL